MKRRIVILVLAIGVVASAAAQFHKTTDGRANHYVTFSLAGGGTMMFSHYADNAPVVNNKIGADALFAFTYEVRARDFIFGFGAQADYDYSWQKIDDFVHLSNRFDREDDEIVYAYRYSDYQDVQHNVQLSIPLYAGYNIGRYMYILAGAKVSLSLFAQHKTNTMLSTDGTYIRFIHTIENAPTYGYYPKDEYTYTARYEAPELSVSPMLDLGARIPVSSKSGRLAMRLGLYAEYAFPLSFSNKLELVDYSRVDKSPFTQQQDQLRSSIVFNSPLNTILQVKAFSQLTVGIKWTLLINVTPPEHVCMCDR